MDSAGLKCFIAACEDRESGFHVSHNLDELDPVVQLPSGEIISSEADFLKMVEAVCEQGFNGTEL